MLTLVNCAVVFLAITWGLIIYRAIRAGQSSPRSPLVFILCSSVIAAFALYMTQTSVAIELANNVNPSEHIPGFAKMAFVGVKATIFASVFSLVCLKKSRFLTVRGIRLLALCSLFTATVMILNIAAA